MSVSEFRWDFPREARCHPMLRCASIAPSLLRPRRKPCQFGEKCSSPPSETVSLTICSEKAFSPRASDVDDTGAQHSFLTVTFVDQGAVSVVCAARCMEWSLRVYQNGRCFARVYFSAVFVISSTPMPASRLSPTDRYDSDAHTRKSSAGALHRGAALRLFPLRQLNKRHGSSPLSWCTPKPQDWHARNRQTLL